MEMDERQEAITDSIIREFLKIRKKDDLIGLLVAYELNGKEDLDFALRMWNTLRRIWSAMIKLAKEDDKGNLIYSGYSITEPWAPDSGLRYLYADLLNTCPEMRLITYKQQKNFIQKFMRVFTSPNMTRVRDEDGNAIKKESP